MSWIDIGQKINEKVPKNTNNTRPLLQQILEEGGHKTKKFSYPDVLQDVYKARNKLVCGYQPCNNQPSLNKQSKDKATIQFLIITFCCNARGPYIGHMGNNACASLSAEHNDDSQPGL